MVILLCFLKMVENTWYRFFKNSLFDEVNENKSDSNNFSVLFLTPKPAQSKKAGFRINFIKTMKRFHTFACLI